MRITPVTLADIKRAADLIKLNPGKYGKHEREIAERTDTPGRYQQRRLAAGRAAITEVLQERGTDPRHLTAAIRAGAIAEGKLEPSWNFINDLGARALGLPDTLED